MPRGEDFWVHVRIYTEKKTKAYIRKTRREEEEEEEAIRRFGALFSPHGSDMAGKHDFEQCFTRAFSERDTFCASRIMRSLRSVHFSFRCIAISIEL